MSMIHMADTVKTNPIVGVPNQVEYDYVLHISEKMCNIPPG